MALVLDLRYLRKYSRPRSGGWLSDRRADHKKGQTALEYMMLIVVLILPLAFAVQEFLQDSGDNTKDNLMRRIVTDAHGDEDHLGIIGRPYP